MRKISVLFISFLVPSPASADDIVFYDQAKIEHIRPVRWMSAVYRGERCPPMPNPFQPIYGPSAIAPAVGAAAGGAFGNQVAGVPGQAVGRVVGSLAGTAIVSGAANPTAMRCQPVMEQVPVDGYEVTYRYGGRIGKSLVPRDPWGYPGSIRVRVTVTPVP